MKLYYAPHTCSLSPHIVLRELSLPFELVRVNNRTKRTEHGQDFWTINPKGYVAALETEDGRIITEGPVILNYLAGLKPETGLIPKDKWENIRLHEWLAFINSELHAGLAPLFNSVLPAEARAIFLDKVSTRFDVLEHELRTQNQYLMGAHFSIADAYLFTVLGWCRFFDIELDEWPALSAYMARISERPSVQAALKAEQNRS
ncbi:glutathione transferase GstA [Larsenimonas rhizosphaerae]|uniref:glutathione transferase GstA n=1 Tax=Larsenimonas rhizosphaerae TaxID=2944682 RepID=UPI002033BBDE|nr:glutathione transferase GstA [Larsenimonas rhizosphaerae]MCM2130055.1 glutathione transferase GstA [Larsenimonas rhizosphaerae]